jgi:AMP deaminase
VTSQKRHNFSGILAPADLAAVYGCVQYATAHTMCVQQQRCTFACIEGLGFALQIPRLYAVYKEQGIIETFEQMLDNIFTPLFEVTKDPTSHPQLHLFLKQVGLWSCSAAASWQICSHTMLGGARVLGFGGPCSR